MAFVSSLTVFSFHGQHSLQRRQALTPRQLAPSGPTMAYAPGPLKALEKYNEMASTGPGLLPTEEPTFVSASVVIPSPSPSRSDPMLYKYAAMSRPDTEAPHSPPVKPTVFWKRVPYKSPDELLVDSFYPYMAAYRSSWIRSFPPGGSPVTSPADQYMAGVVSRTYKMSACLSGVYSVRCTEGTTRGQAEDARTAALAYEFRLKQRSTLQKFGDFFETRRSAVAAAHMCSYEEALNANYAATASALVRGMNEAKATCVRYSSTQDAAEQYMLNSVDKQNKFRAVPHGVYDVMCSDGTTGGMAEQKRVVALSAKFRFGQIAPTATEQHKFDAAKYARDNFSHMCSYEEELFNTYPSVAGAMRARNVRYS